MKPTDLDNPYTLANPDYAKVYRRIMKRKERGKLPKHRDVKKIIREEYDREMQKRFEKGKIEVPDGYEIMKEVRYMWTDEDGKEHVIPEPTLIRKQDPKHHKMKPQPKKRESGTLDMW